MENGFEDTLADILQHCLRQDFLRLQEVDIQA
jgi:hypothetical protein